MSFFLKLVKLLNTPGMIPVVLRKPPALSIVDGAGCLLSLPQAEVAKVEQELTSDRDFRDALDSALLPAIGRRYASDGWAEFLYCIVRILNPEVVVETGVFQGSSSAHILRAMERNKSGHLVSIDLPATSEDAGRDSTDRMGDSLLPAGCAPGWIIPSSLRARHELRLGDSGVLLPKVFAEFPMVDIFIHDSLHTEGHMRWEYETSWPHIKNGGLLLSDDIFWNPAMHRFSRKVAMPYVQCLGKFGGLRKTTAA